MKRISLIVILLLGFNADAQINVGSNAISSMNKAGKLSEDDINELKQTTTLFTLQYKDYDRITEFEKAISEVWKITKFKIIKPDELGQYEGKDGYSYFTFGGFYRVTTHSMANASPHPTSQHLSYDLWTPDINKKGKMKGNNYYSRILLSPDAKVFSAAVESYGRHFSDKMVTFLYNEAVFYNWSPGLLKGYLKTVNDLLAEQETRGPFTSDEDEQGLMKLRRDTLYVPDYVNISYSGLTGTEQVPDEDEKETPTGYPFKIKYVTTAQLNEMIMNPAKPFYYLVYVRSSTDKFVNVYKSDKGMVYARYKAMSYNFKSKDLGYIAKNFK